MVVYRARFPWTEEELESPDFKTVFTAALRLSRYEKLDCQIYRVDARLTKIGVDGSLYWQSVRETGALLYDLEYLKVADLIMLSRVASWRQGLRTFMLIKARPDPNPYKNGKTLDGDYLPEDCEPLVDFLNMSNEAREAAENYLFSGGTRGNY